MRFRPAARPVVIFFCALLVPSAHAASPYWWDDAGSGRDAGGESSPLQLPAYGDYAGYLLPTRHESDWYASPVGHDAPACVEATVASAPTADATLFVATPTDLRRVSLGSAGGEGARLGLAGSHVAAALLGVANPQSDPSNHGNYTFSLAGIAASGVSRDAGVADAPALFQMAVPVEGGCFGGRIGGIASGGDVADAFRVATQSGGNLVVSFASLGAVELHVHDASGQEIARVPDGGLVVIPLAAGGPTYLRASSLSTASTAYVVGLVLGPPDEEPCRPHCVVQVG